MDNFTPSKTRKEVAFWDEVPKPSERGIEENAEATKTVIDIASETNEEDKRDMKQKRNSGSNKTTTLQKVKKLQHYLDRILLDKNPIPMGKKRCFLNLKVDTDPSSKS